MIDQESTKTLIYPQNNSNVSENKGMIKMNTQEQLQKALTDIEFILRQNNDKIGKFEDPNFTLGYISSIVERINGTENIY